MLSTRHIALVAISLATYLGAAAPNCLAQSAAEKRVEQQVIEIENSNPRESKRAAARLTMVDPKSINKSLRNRVAKAFRSQVLDSPTDENVRGLIHWAGKYSTPVLIESLKNSKMRANVTVIDALVNSEDPDAAAAFASKLGDFFNHAEMADALKLMGEVAEPAVIAAMKNGDDKQIAKAIEILGEIGTEKSLKELKRLSKRGSQTTRGTAQVAIMRLSSRLGATVSNAEPATVDNDDPFAESSSGSTGSGMGGHPMSGDFSQIYEPLTEEPEAGAFKPDPLPAEIKFPRKPKPVRLAKYPGRMGKMSAAMVARNQPERIGTLTIDPFKETPAMIQLVDVARGRALPPIPLPAHTVQAALSPDGRKIVAVAELKNAARIEVYELGAKETKLLSSWTPYTKSRGLGGVMFATDMQWIRWINQEQFITLNRAGNLVVWDANGAVARLQFEVEGWAIPALSPNGGQVAVNSENRIVVFDTKSGETLFWGKEKTTRSASLGFDSTGKQLAAVFGTRIQVWDLASGELTTDFNVKEMVTPKGLAFNGDRLIVHGTSGVDIVDLNQRRVLHHFTHSYDCTSYNNQLLACERSFTRNAIYPCKLNFDEPSSSEVSDLDAMLAIKPGAEISLDVRIGSGLDTEVREFLTKAAEEAGLVINASSSMKFVARKETNSKTVNYQSLHAFRDKGTNVNVKEKTYSVILHVDGEPAWKYASYQRSVSHLQMKAGESVQQASDRATKTSSSYFKGIQLPRYLVHPDYAGPLETTPLRGR